jgi:hypothetical protein
MRFRLAGAGEQGRRDDRYGRLRIAGLPQAFGKAEAEPLIVRRQCEAGSILARNASPMALRCQQPGQVSAWVRMRASRACNPVQNGCRRGCFTLHADCETKDQQGLDIVKVVIEKLAAELFRLPMMATFEAFQRDVQPRKPLRAIHDPLSMMPCLRGTIGRPD